MIDAVGYIRMSSDKQEASPVQQRQEIKKLAERDGYRIVRWYVDEGISGDATEKRLGFQRMIQDAKGGEFHAVLCWDQDRFGRFDSIEAGHWIHPIREHGVYLVTVAQGKIDWNDFAGRMLYGIQQEGKHAYLRDLSKNVCRGLRAKAQRGEWPAGNPPFGFVVGEDSKLGHGDPLHVSAVQRVYQEYLHGHSMMAIAEIMQADKEPAPGLGWTIDTVKGILRNRLYTGDFVWGSRSTGRYNVATDEPVEILNNHSSLVSKPIFDAVQKRRLEQRGGKTPKRNGGSFVLAGLLTCNECGSAMYGHNSTGHPYLICSGHLRRGNSYCSRNSVREDIVLEHVISAIEDAYLNPKTIRDLRQELYRQVDNQSSKVNSGKLKRRLSKVEKDLATARRNMALAELELRTDYEQVLRELKSEQQRLTAAIKAAGLPVKQLKTEQDQKVDKAIQLFSQLRQSLLKADTVRLREFLRTAIDKIVVRVAKSRQGRRNSYRLLGGDIHMKVYDLGLTPRWTHM